jgi:mRNA interferase RelE/StbE
VKYRILVGPQVDKDLTPFPFDMRRRILEHIALLAHQLRPPGCIKLVGRGDLWRIRFGSYRAVDAINPSALVVRIEYIRHRKDAYR